MIKKIQQLPRGIRWFFAAHVGAVATISVASWWVGEHLAEHPTQTAVRAAPAAGALVSAAVGAGGVAALSVRSAGAGHVLPVDPHDAPRMWSYDLQGQVVMAQPESSPYR